MSLLLTFLFSIFLFGYLGRAKGVSGALSASAPALIHIRLLHFHFSLFNFPVPSPSSLLVEIS
jgi:hypothetical protein